MKFFLDESEIKYIKINKSEILTSIHTTIRMLL